jgi:Zn-dependent peptidase ImmA (M78 family)
MPRGTKVPITPTVLKWAVDESGYDRAAIAKAAGATTAALDAWMAGREQPNATAFRKLAVFLARPEAVFFLPEAPASSRVQVKFRAAPGASPRKPLPTELLRIREAARLQRGLAWVMDELGEKLLTLPALSLEQDPEAAAEIARSDLGIDEEQQLAWTSASAAQHGWRRALEDRGVAVFLLPMGKDAVRGFSLWDEKVPLVAVNTHWNPEARAFTMFHEYAHLLTRTSSMCAQPAAATPPRGSGDPVERWCERFAAAFLAPWAAVDRLLVDRYEWTPGEPIEDLRVASYVAKKLRISLRAAVLRLINHGVAGWALYKKIPPAADAKRGGGPATGGRHRPQIRADEYGMRTLRTFLEGVRRDAITRDDALRYLDVADTQVAELEAAASVG